MQRDDAGLTPLGGMVPWACSYDGADGRYCIILYGTDPRQVLEDNCADLPGLKVDGRLEAKGKLI